MNKDFKALAIDPGGTTGLCWAQKTGTRLVLKSYQLKLTPIRFANTLSMFNKDHGPDVWFICESFEFRKGARAGLDLTPAHLIGVLMAHCGDAVDNEVRRSFFQTAAQGKGYFSDDKLKQLGIYLRGRPHAMDATRHLLQWYKFGFGYQFYDENTEVEQHGE